MVSAGIRWCGAFLVVKTAQSRVRTGRTLLKALSQLLWPNRGSRGVVFLERKPRKGPPLRSAPIAKLLAALDFCSPQAPSRGAGMLRTGVMRRFDVTLPFCYTQVIAPTSADAFPVVGGRCTGRTHRGKAKQGVVARRLRRVDAYFHTSTSFGPCPEIILATMAALCYFIIAPGSDCWLFGFTLAQCSWTEPRHRSRG